MQLKVTNKVSGNVFSFKNQKFSKIHSEKSGASYLSWYHKRSYILFAYNIIDFKRIFRLIKKTVRSQKIFMVQKSNLASDPGSKKNWPWDLICGGGEIPSCKILNFEKG